MAPILKRITRSCVVVGSLMAHACLAESPITNSLARLKRFRGGYSMPRPPQPPPSQQPLPPASEGESAAQQRGSQLSSNQTPRPWGPTAAGAYSYQKYYTATPNEKQDVLFPRIMRAVSNSAVCVLFLVLTARTTHLYEMADQVRGTFGRYLATVPAVLLLSADLIGVLLSLIHSFKRNSRLKARLKAIVALNGVSEVVMMLYNIFRLVIGNDKWTPREAYVGRLIVSVWFLGLTYSFATTRWESTTAGGHHHHQG